ncbi:beta-glucanase (GH16 family) [Allocatelliglobosispora scoriae]|uniref:Beta-glucanase (GH16 family) n=1 Tax=Allocatelliglobosispora scoriae TaxID=643052 RepID=A0A841BEW6_9ACTN|nr:glycoside hydrolase family 16 protein [Allocatelliglobosispora scoriae]MBB5867627.1 beta-glucanase (GH16 family) [Allocatelliglobosispora scoriae]
MTVPLRRIRRRGLVILASAALIAAGTLLGPAAPAANAAIGGLTWSDEFNAAAGTGPNSAKWNFDLGGGGFGNNELQYYTNRTQNVAHDGAGNLVITARKENPGGYGCWYGSCTYTSARLKTEGKFTQAYGRFESRMKLPRGQGIWPAFWMLGDNIGSVGWPQSGEIDIMENVGFEPNIVHGTLHGPGYSGCCGLGQAYTNGAPLADAFHTYAVDWAPDSITWYIDGIQYGRKTPADAGGNQWVFNHPFFMILNLAVGGNWPGSPNASTVFPQTLTVDYVRVYSWTSGPGGGGKAITGPGGKCIDVNAAGTANGTKIQLWGCNGTNAQQWTIGSDIRALGKCLDVASGGTANGTKVQLWDCNGSGAQVWQRTGINELYNPQSQKCLDATGGSTADGTQLQIWACTGGAAQKWYPAA